MQVGGGLFWEDRTLVVRELKEIWKGESVQDA
jgi:hypothetical protein